MDEQELISKLTSQILSKFRKAGYGIKPKEVSERLRLLLLEFKIPESKAVRTIENYLMKDFGISRKHFKDEAKIKKASIQQYRYTRLTEILC